MDLSRLERYELLGLASAALLVIALFLPWFSLTHEPVLRHQQDAWVCGTGNYDCSGWQTFPINRWLLLAAAAAPFRLLVFFNGIVQKPGSGVQFGISISYGYYLAMLAGLGLAVAGALRSLESGGGAQRKPPATY